MAKAISQSDTEWIPAKKNAAGKVIQKGYLIQKSTGKKYTGNVNIVQATSSGKTAGSVAKYSKGRDVIKPVAGSGSKKNTPPPPPARKKADDARALSRRAGAKPAVVKAAAKSTRPSNSSVVAEKRVASTRRKETRIEAPKAKPSWNPGGGMQGEGGSTVGDWVKDFFGSRGGWTSAPKKKR